MPTKSKFFRVATEGATTDGREITRTDIEQMAKSYDPAKYAARVWLEHYRGLVPGGSFDALGDVTAIESREVEGGKLALFAQIEPLPKLIEMNKAKQKLYSSVEIHPRLGDTGGAYLFGLGVTDSPASLGTEVLKFSQTATASPFADRKADKSTLYAASQEFTLELEPELPEATTGLCAALTPNEKGTGYCIAQAGGDVRALTKALNAALNGRGGGKPGICQGSCAAAPEQVKEFLRKTK